ncbi:MAG: hypothetical protein ACLFS9_02340 [Nitriliruptoraceae bacterium]
MPATLANLKPDDDQPTSTETRSLAVADRYTSLIALHLDAPVTDLAEIVRAAGSAGDLDRAAPVRGRGDEAQEVQWGGRLQRAVVRAMPDPDDGAPLLRSEAYLGEDGLADGLQRQAKLLQSLARQLSSSIVGIRDLSARVERETAWLHRCAIGAVEHEDGIVTVVDGEGTRWVRTHGAARFDVPDLELYGCNAVQAEAAPPVLRHVHEQLLEDGLKADLRLPDGTPVYLVPVLEAWQHANLDWPGVGRAGRNRGPGLDGPRATLSVLHRPRLGRYRKDLSGVLEALAEAG